MASAPTTPARTEETGVETGTTGVRQWWDRGVWGGSFQWCPVSTPVNLKVS